MKLHTKFAAIIVAASLTVSASLLLAADRKHRHDNKKSAEAARMDQRERAIHALNRLTFGPRPGDVEKVMAMGVDKWIDQQLHPSTIDNSALDARLAPYRTLQMSTGQLIADFPPPQLFKAIADGRIPMPRDPYRRAVYEASLQRYQAQLSKKQDGAQAQPADVMQMPLDQMTPEQKQQRRQIRQDAYAKLQQLEQLPADSRMTALIQMDPVERRDFYRALDPIKRQQLTADLTPRQKETLLAIENPIAVVNGEAMAGKLLRAAYSDRQLQEVMTDFWFNHFNVFIGKGLDRYMVTSYERDVIRPNALGKFKDLLLATAKSPAMLFYLDNWQSVGPDSDVALHRNPRPNFNRAAYRRRRMGGVFFPQMARFPRNRPNARNPQNPNAAPRGINENYAREVMELHTLGVNGGYTQQDVIELARILTGWTIAQPLRGGSFVFNPRMHEPGSELFLGHVYKDDGEKEGEKALAFLARQPATARHICTELAERFVSDDPPPSLVDRMTKTWLSTDGDIRQVLGTMFHSPEFWNPDVYRVKVKTPFEFVVSAVRATDANVQNPAPLIQTINRMGEPLYGCQPPNGYSTKARPWVNSGALLDRMNFSVALGLNRLPGVRIQEANLLGPTPPSSALAAQDRLEAVLLDGNVSKQTHDIIEKRLTDPMVTGRKLDDPPRPPNLGVIAGLILGSPEFQRH